METSRNAWLGQLATRLGVDPPTDDEVRALLRLATIAAHASERAAAPLSCWLVARSGVSADEGMEIAADLAGSPESGRSG